MNILPPAQTDKSVNKNTPINPTTGCQAGITTGVACLTTISIGVKGGNSDSQVDKELRGSCNTGNITNIGNMTGSIAGNWRDWASLESLQADPNAAIIDPIMIIFSIRKAKNHGRTWYGINSWKSI